MSIPRTQRLAAMADLGLIDGATQVTVHQRAVYRDEIHIDDQCASGYQVTRRTTSTVADLHRRYPTKVLCENCAQTYLRQAMPWASDSDNLALGLLTNTHALLRLPRPGSVGKLRAGLTVRYDTCSPQVRQAAADLADRAAPVDRAALEHPARAEVLDDVHSQLLNRAVTRAPVAALVADAVDAFPTTSRWAELYLAHQMTSADLRTARRIAAAADPADVTGSTFEGLRQRLADTLAGDLVWVTSPSLAAATLWELAENFDVHHPNVVRVPRLAAAICSIGGDDVRVLTDAPDVTAAELDQALNLSRDPDADVMSVVTALRATAA